MKVVEENVVSNKTVLLRLDLDLTDQEISNGNHPRILFSLPTLQFLAEYSKQVLVISHRGRPNGEDLRYSLKIFVETFSKLLNSKVGFCSGLDPKEVKNFDQKVVLLENLRFDSGEESNDSRFAKSISELAEIYVFDSFAVSHREHASVVGIPKYLPTYVGFNFVKELESLDKFLKSSQKPKLAIIGGAKLETKLPVIKKMLQVADKVLVGGKLLEEEIPESSSAEVKDVLIARLNKGAYSDIKTIPLTEFKNYPDFNILDIGSKTLESYTNSIESSKMVIWNGPMGLFEKKEFSNGTLGIANAIADSGSFSIVGGGETLEVVLERSLEKKFSHLCLGGGAMLDYLATSKLAFLEVVDG